jgi:hypothetical protein
VPEPGQNGSVFAFDFSFITGILVLYFHCFFFTRRGLRKRRPAEPDDADTESAQENNKVACYINTIKLHVRF